MARFLPPAGKFTILFALTLAPASARPQQGAAGPPAAPQAKRAERAPSAYGNPAPAAPPTRVYAPPYTSADASRDAYLRGEARRQSLVAQQLGAIERLKQYASSYLPYDRDIYYRPAYGPRVLHPRLEYGRSALYSRGVIGGRFEPWPVVEGDIWGRPYLRSVEQPIGQRQTQTGPNRWESHPIYARPAAVEPTRLPQAAERAGPAPAAPPAAPVSPPPASGREF